MTPQEAYKRIKFKLFERSPELESIIATDSEYSYFYAFDVLKDRFPLGEYAISQNAYYACEYAIHVIRGRWPLGEAVIATDAEEAYYYATHVTGNRFHRAEGLILSSEFAEEYCDCFGIKPEKVDWQKVGF